MKKILIAAAVVVASVAFAAATIHHEAQVFRGGFWAGLTASKTAANKVAGMYAASATIDFADAGTGVVCEDSSAITVTGAQVGDPCVVGIDSATVAAGNSTFSCYALADQAKVRHCPAGTAVDPTSATFRVRVISSR